MTTVTRGQYVDTWVNLHTERRELDDNIQRWFAKTAPDISGGYTGDYVVQKMDESGVQIGLLTDGRGHQHWCDAAAGSGLRGMGGSPLSGGYHGLTIDRFRETCETVADACKAYPGRLYGAAYIDPTKGMDAVRMLEMSVKEYDFRACRIMPAQINLPPNHALYYPIYAKCIELGIPITINIGFPGPLRPAWVQQPLFLDEVLVTFPELTVVGTHVGHPWHIETVALLQKHANFYLMTSGWVPKYLPSEIIHFMNTRGQHKVMWAADFPLLTFERCLDEALKLPLKDNAMDRYLRHNALEVFRLG